MRACMQFSCAALHLYSKLSCVCLYGHHCNVMPNVHTWRAELVSKSVCHDCRSLLAAQVSWSQSIAALTSLFSLSMLTASRVLGMYASSLPTEQRGLHFALRQCCSVLVLGHCLAV